MRARWSASTRFAAVGKASMLKPLKHLAARLGGGRRSGPVDDAPAVALQSKVAATEVEPVVKTVEVPVSDPKLDILNNGWGHELSWRNRRAMDRDGEPLPWFTYPAIEYFSQLDFSRARIFEWGAGSSSLWWSRHAREVISVERNPEWHEFVKGQLRENMTLHLASDDPAYEEVVLGYEDLDVIVIDGEMRRECAVRAAGRLAQGGLIILDNSDWYTKAAAELRAQGFAQVDFNGFGPVNNYTWTTSLFMRAEFKFSPLHERLPMHAIGGLKKFAAEESETTAPVAVEADPAGR